LEIFISHVGYIFTFVLPVPHRALPPYKDGLVWLYSQRRQMWAVRIGDYHGVQPKWMMKAVNTIKV
jgi:hypothetical protein